MDACEKYSRHWAKKEYVELDSLSKLIKSIGNVVKCRIRRLKHSVNTRSESIYRDPDVVHELSSLHEYFIIVASNNYTFVCKEHYVASLTEELHSLPGNPTYSLTAVSASEVLDNHQSVLTPFGIQIDNDEQLVCLSFIAFLRCTKIHINIDSLRVLRSVRPSLCPFYSKKLLTHIKQGIQKNCETAYSRSGINQMWIIENSKELLYHLKSHSLRASDRFGHRKNRFCLNSYCWLLLVYET